MSRSDRLFEVIQLLRGANRPLRAEDMATELEVSKRTIYRDIAALQAMRTPIEGEAGIGYILRNGYDLPPLNFDEEELEALHLGLSMLARTGDIPLQRAADRVMRKICDLPCAAEFLHVDPCGVPVHDPAQGCVSLAVLRQAVRDSLKLEVVYVDDSEQESCRVLRPVALTYYVHTIVLAAWCELRGAFRHFRSDRILSARLMCEDFGDEAPVLRKLWCEQQRVDVAVSAAE